MTWGIQETVLAPTAGTINANLPSPKLWLRVRQGARSKIAAASRRMGSSWLRLHAVRFSGNRQFGLCAGFPAVFFAHLRKMPWAFVRGMIWLEICNDGQTPPMMGPGGPPPPWNVPGFPPPPPGGTDHAGGQQLETAQKHLRRIQKELNKLRNSYLYQKVDNCLPWGSKARMQQKGVWQPDQAREAGKRFRRQGGTEAQQVLAEAPRSQRPRTPQAIHPFTHVQPQVDVRYLL